MSHATQIRIKSVCLGQLILGWPISIRTIDQGIKVISSMTGIWCQLRLQPLHLYNCFIQFIPFLYMFTYRPKPEDHIHSSYTVYRWLNSLHIRSYKHNSLRRFIAWLYHYLFLLPASSIETMAHQQTRDNPDPKNILPDNEKRKWNTTNRAQGLNSYFKTVEATTKPRQAQG